MFTKMKYSELLLIVFIINVIQYGGMDALKVVSMQDLSGKIIQVQDPSMGSLSSGTLKSHTSGSYYCGDVKNLTLSAPRGYSILAAIRLLDLRSYYRDNLTLINGNDFRSSATYSNRNKYSSNRIFDPNESETFIASSGQLGVSFATAEGFSWSNDGFELTYTVFSHAYICRSGEFLCNNHNCIASSLTCDGHNHCGDRSDQSYTLCYKPPTPKEYNNKSSNLAGIICGVILLLIAVGCGVYIIVRKSRRSTTTSSTIIHPPPTYQPSTQPGTYPPPPMYQPPTQPLTSYPPPPPHSGGYTNPTYS